MSGWLAPDQIYENRFPGGGEESEQMARFSRERRNALLQKLLPPHNLSMGELARQDGNSEPMLYAWLQQAKAEGATIDIHAATCRAFNPINF